MTTKVAYMRDGGPLSKAEQAAVQRFVVRHFTPNLRLRRRPLPEAGSYAFGPPLEVTIEVHRCLRGTAASVPEMGIRCVAHGRDVAVARAALAVLRLAGRGGHKPPCSVSFEVLRLDIDDRTPEQRKIDGQVYRLAEAGKLFADFKPPKPRKRVKKKRSGAKRTGARRKR